MKCWAAPLADCSGGSSREHYISDGIFSSQTINAFGLEWCRDSPKDIGLAKATAKILCRKHNNALSVLDAEAARFSKFVTENVLDTPLKAARLDLDGRSLEKWAIKTCLNLGVIGALDPLTHVRITPSESLVRVVFSDDLPPDGMGLYFLHDKVNNQDYHEGLSWHPIRNRGDGDKVVGMFYVFNGFRFVVSVAPVRAEPLLLKMGVLHGFDFGRARIDYRPQNIRMKSNSGGEKLITLSW